MELHLRAFAVVGSPDGDRLPQQGHVLRLGAGISAPEEALEVAANGLKVIVQEH